MSEPKRTAFEAARRWSDANHWWGEGRADDGVPAATAARILIDQNGLPIAYPNGTAGLKVVGNLVATGDVDAVNSSLTGNLTVGGSRLLLTAIPTSDPALVGQVWSDAGVLTVSAG